MTLEQMRRRGDGETGRRNPRAIPSPRHPVAPSLTVLFFLLSTPAAHAANPTPTPTARPRLTGGFGRTPVAGRPQGQSLADVVRAASDAKARKEQKGSLAITNQTLVTDPKKGKLTTASPRNVGPTPRPEAAASAPTPAGAESEWHERARAARARVAEALDRVERLERESKKLENDFYSWDDGQYRDGVIKPAWDKKREELETARRELADAQRDLADLPERARKAGALPGWIRE